MKNLEIVLIKDDCILDIKANNYDWDFGRGEGFALEIRDCDGYKETVGCVISSLLTAGEVKNLSGQAGKLSCFEKVILAIRAYNDPGFQTNKKNEIIITTDNYENLIIRKASNTEVKEAIKEKLFVYFNERPNEYINGLSLYCSMYYDISVIRNSLLLLKEIGDIENEPHAGTWDDRNVEHWHELFRLKPEIYNDYERRIRDREIQAESIKDSNTTVEKIKIFVSYSSKDKIMAGKLKKELEQYCVEVFLAHHDIEPSREWQDEILENLNGCHVFLLLLSDNFHPSFWTDQESGIAFSNKKVIIPLKLSINPYGFMGRYQALEMKKENIETTCEEIIKIVGSKSELQIEFRNSLIEKFSKSKSFEKAQQNSALLCSYQNYNAEQIEQIIKSALENYQIHQSFMALENIKRLMAENNYKIDDSLMRKFNERLLSHKD